jgi:hypothetical protein
LDQAISYQYSCQGRLGLATSSRISVPVPQERGTRPLPKLRGRPVWSDKKLHLLSRPSRAPRFPNRLLR